MLKLTILQWVHKSIQLFLSYFFYHNKSSFMFFRIIRWFKTFSNKISWNSYRGNYVIIIPLDCWEWWNSQNKRYHSAHHAKIIDQALAYNDHSATLTAAPDSSLKCLPKKVQSLLLRLFLSVNLTGPWMPRYLIKHSSKYICETVLG